MIPTPTISVVVATYNYGQFLAGALESILAQTFTDYEVIVVDDGSTDNTSNVVQPYLVDLRIHYLRTEHLGQPAAKNAGIRQARGEYIAFLDADDLWLPMKLEKQVALFRRDSELGVVYSHRLLIDEEGFDLVSDRPVLYRGDVLEMMFRDNFVCFSSSMVARSVFDHVGLFDESLQLAIDYDLWLRVAARFWFDYVDEPLVKYRVGHASLSRRGEERLETALIIMHRFLDGHGGRYRLSAGVARRAFAETYAHIGLIRRDRSRLAALMMYLRALVVDPAGSEAWRELVGLALPEQARRWLRRLLGKSIDWKVHCRTTDF